MQNSLIWIGFFLILGIHIMSNLHLMKINKKGKSEINKSMVICLRNGSSNRYFFNGWKKKYQGKIKHVHLQFAYLWKNSLLKKPFWHISRASQCPLYFCQHQCSVSVLCPWNHSKYDFQELILFNPSLRKKKKEDFLPTLRHLSCSTFQNCRSVVESLMDCLFWTKETST